MSVLQQTIREAAQAATPAEAAACYAAGNLKIFPADPATKRPLVRWTEEATSDFDQVKAWWEQWPKAMIGLPTEVNGLAVVDVDGARHDANMIGDAEKALTSSLGELPVTLKVATPSGGYHLFFADDPTDPIKSRNGFVPGVDVKARGAYVIAAGSRRDDRKAYTVSEANDIAALAPSARFVLARSAPTRSAERQHVPTDDLKAMASELAGTQPGNRNNRLNQLAYAAAQAGLVRDDVHGAFLRAADQNGMIADDGETAFEQTFASGFEKGARMVIQTPPPMTTPVNGPATRSLSLDTMKNPPKNFWNTKNPHVPFPVEILPEGMRYLCEGIVRDVQCAPAVTLLSLLTTVSFIAQGHFNVQHFEGRDIPVSIFGLTIAGQSERKSGADKATSGFLTPLQKDLAEKYRKEVAEHMRESQVVTSLERGLKKDLEKAARSDDEEADQIAKKMAELVKPVPPMKPGFRYTDITWEGLYSGLAFARPSAFLQSDEAGALLGGHSFSAEKALQTFAKLNKLWDGDPVDKHRATSDPNNGHMGMRLPEILFDKRLSLHLMMQPAVFSGFVHGEKTRNSDIAHGTGFLGRCLIIRPPSVAATIRPGAFRRSDDAERARLTRCLADAAGIEPRIKEETYNDLKIQLLRSGPDLFDIIEEYSVALDHQSAPGEKYEIVRPLAGKSRDHVLRIAANFLVASAILEGGAGLRALVEDEDRQKLDETSVRTAIDVFQWFLDEALRIFSASTLSKAEEDAVKILEYVHEHDIASATRTKLKDRGQVFRGNRFDAAIEVLERNGWVHTVASSQNGKTLRRYHFHLIDDAFEPSASETQGTV